MNGLVAERNGLAIGRSAASILSIVRVVARRFGRLEYIDDADKFPNSPPLASWVSGSANEISSTLCLRSVRTVNSCSN
jgi:hypothetical protein